MHFVKSVVSFYYENNNLMMEQMDFKDLPQITNLEQDECNKLPPPPIGHHYICVNQTKEFPGMRCIIYAVTTILFDLLELMKL